MTRLITIAGLFIAIGIHASFIARDKWKMLFDGKTHKGWHLYGKDHAGDCWQIEDNALHLVPVKDGGDKGDLVTDESFDNFDLKLEWKVASGSNSGVIFLVHEDTTLYKATFVTGLEMQVLDNIGAEDNKQENHLAGALYDLAGKAADSKPKPVGEWNNSEIVCDHGQLKLYLNGILVAATTLWDDHWKEMVAHSKFKNMPAFGTFKSGRIALQYHGGEVWYRNIRLKDLN
jgi:hypothetical protein